MGGPSRVALNFRQSPWIETLQPTNSAREVHTRRCNQHATEACSPFAAVSFEAAAVAAEIVAGRDESKQCVAVDGNGATLANWNMTFYYSDNIQSWPSLAFTFNFRPM